MNNLPAICAEFGLARNDAFALASIDGYPVSYANRNDDYAVVVYVNGDTVAIDCATNCHAEIDIADYNDADFSATLADAIADQNEIMARYER